MTYTLEQWQSLGNLEPAINHHLFVVDSKQSDEQADSKPVLLLVHGFPTASWDWHHQWDSLAEHFRLITADMLGFGFSDKPAHHDYSIHEQADLLTAILQRRNISRCHVLAHDYGDTVAQELLARSNLAESNHVSLLSVCLLNGGLFPETHRARPIQKALLSPIGALLTRLMGKRSLARNMRSVFGPQTPPSEGELENFWKLINYNDGRLILNRLMRYMRDRIDHRQRWLDALVSARIPVGLINGLADPVSGEHMVARYRELVGKENIVELENIGHYPQLEAPQDVLRHALEFFKTAQNNGSL